MHLRPARVRKRKGYGNPSVVSDTLFVKSGIAPSAEELSDSLAEPAMVRLSPVRPATRSRPVLVLNIRIINLDTC